MAADGTSPWPKWPLEKEVQAPVLQASGVPPSLQAGMAVPSTAHREGRVVHSCVGTMTPETQTPECEASNHFLDQTAIPLPENAALGHAPVLLPVSPSPCLKCLHGDPELVPLRSSEQGRHEDQEGLDSNPPSPTL